MTKSDVNGEDANDVYNQLRAEFSFQEEGKAEGEIPWNFAKFLVTAEGKVLGYYSPSVEPNELIPAISEILEPKATAEVEAEPEADAEAETEPKAEEAPEAREENQN